MAITKVREHATKLTNKLYSVSTSTLHVTYSKLILEPSDIYILLVIPLLFLSSPF